METQKGNKQELVKKDSQELSLNTSILTPERTIVNVARIKIVYPMLSEGFYDILLERLLFYKFSDLEFEKTINHIIDTNKYPPQISDFISYMRPDGVSDIPIQEENPKGYHDIDFANVPKNEEDLSFLDKYSEEDNN